MPTSADLDRLEALVERLTPLADTAPGELIRAQDWNLLVGALIEVARAAIGGERAEAEVPPHEHPDQVAAGWLTPALRELFERGPLADPAATGRLGDLERRLGRLSDVASRIDADLGTTRASVAEVATRDVARAADVNQIRRTVDGLGDARQDVAVLRGTLKSLEDSVKVAVDVSSRLTIDGQPVDMEAVGARLKSVEAVRDRLTMPDGNLLDATAFEKRLGELRATLVTQKDLDDALKNRPGRIDPDQVAGLRDDLRATLGKDLDSRLDVASGDFRRELDQRFAGVGDLVTTKLGEAMPGLSETVLAGARAEVDARVGALRDESRALLDDRLGKLDTALQGRIETSAQELRAFAPEAAKAVLQDALPGTLQPLQARLDALDTRAGTLEERQQSLQRGLTALGRNVQEVSRAQEDGMRAMRAEVDAKIGAERARTDGRFDDIEGRIPRRITDVLAEQLAPAVEEQVQATFARALTDLDGRLRSIAADTVGEAEARINQRTEGLVAERVQAAQGELGQRLDTQLSQGLERMPKRVLSDMQDDLGKIMDRRIEDRLRR